MSRNDTYRFISCLALALFLAACGKHNREKETGRDRQPPVPEYFQVRAVKITPRHYSVAEQQVGNIYTIQNTIIQLSFEHTLYDQYKKMMKDSALKKSFTAIKYSLSPRAAIRSMSFTLMPDPQIPAGEELFEISTTSEEKKRWPVTEYLAAHRKETGLYPLNLKFREGIRFREGKYTVNLLLTLEDGSEIRAGSGEIHFRN